MDACVYMHKICLYIVCIVSHKQVYKEHHCQHSLKPPAYYNRAFCRLPATTTATTYHSVERIQPENTFCCRLTNLVEIISGRPLESKMSSLAV